MSEPNELTDGYDPSDPPEGNHWCAECAHWDDECTCTYCDICGGRCERWQENAQVCFKCDIEYMAQRQLRWNVETHYEHPPIPSRHCDWIATFDNYDGPGSPVGFGETEAKAISDLIEQEQ